MAKETDTQVNTKLNKAGIYNQQKKPLSTNQTSNFKLARER